jgi:hypothetical protein
MNQINHSEYQKKVKNLSDAALLYIIADCQDALRRLPDSPKAGYYADEICYCSNELNRRRQKQK